MQQTKVVLSEVMMPSHTNPSGNVHGGNIMKIMDSTAYALEVSGIVSKILHDGRQIMICECGIVDASGEIFAKANATFFVIETLEG